MKDFEADIGMEEYLENERVIELYGMIAKKDYGNDKVKGYVSLDKEFDKLGNKIKFLADSKLKKDLEQLLKFAKLLIWKTDIARFPLFRGVRVDVLYSFYFEWVEDCLGILDELYNIFYSIKKNVKRGRT